MESRRDYYQFICLSTVAIMLLGTGATAAEKPSYAKKMQLGQLLYFNGNVDHAIKAFKYAASLKPDAFEPHLNLVNIYVQKQDLNAAIEECREGLKIKPTHRDMHLILGNLLRTQAGSKEAGSTEQKAMLDEAKKELNTAKEMGANEAMINSTLSVLHVQTGDLDKAMEHANAALDKNNKNPDVHLIKGVLHFKKGEKEQAMKELDTAIEQKGKNAEARSTKADMMFSAGKVDEALEEYKKALSDDERYNQARMGIINILISKQKWSEALDHLTKANEVRPDDANVLYSLGICHEKSGNVPAAIQKFNEGVMVDTNPQTKNQIIMHMRELQQANFLPIQNFSPIGGGGGGGLGPGSGLFGAGSGFLQQDMRDLIKIKAPPGETSKEEKKANK